MGEHMTNTSTYGISRETGVRYDVSRHASEGGRASGVRRRTRHLRRLKEGIATGGNAAAKLALLKMELREDRALEAERLRADELLSQLLDQAMAERNRIEALREVRRRGEAEIEALEAREAELRARLESHDGIVAVLGELGEDCVERACLALGWIEAEEDADAPLAK
jgi:hypothetical protein